MRTYALTHVPDEVLLRDLSTLVADERSKTAQVIAHIAEVNRRELYVPAGYSSMFVYCVKKLGLSEHAAYNRIEVARASLRFPEILEWLSDGRLHLTALRLLTSHFTAENFQDLLSSASGKRTKELECFLAERFPNPDLPTRLRALPELVSRRVPPIVTSDSRALPTIPTVTELGVTDGPPARHVERPTKVTPLSPRRFGLQVTLSQETHDKLRRAQELLSHALPSGDVAKVLDRALDELLAKLERQKHAAAWKPPPSCSTGRARHIPADVRRAVWKRDQGACTYVSPSGQRCGERKFVEYDHVEPVSRGGAATSNGIRLRCRTHNQYEAERIFGAGFMEEKRRRRKAAPP